VGPPQARRSSCRARSWWAARPEPIAEYWSNTGELMEQLGITVT
jgi:hypothetical protein